MGTQDAFIVHPETNEQVTALKAFMEALKIKFQISKSDKEYNPDFVAKIRESEKQIAEGKTKNVKREDLKEYLGLE